MAVVWIVFILAILYVAFEVWHYRQRMKSKALQEVQYMKSAAQKDESELTQAVKKAVQ